MSICLFKSILICKSSHSLTRRHSNTLNYLIRLNCSWYRRILPPPPLTFSTARLAAQLQDLQQRSRGNQGGIQNRSQTKCTRKYILLQQLWASMHPPPGGTSSQCWRVPGGPGQGFKFSTGAWTDNSCLSSGVAPCRHVCSTDLTQTMCSQLSHLYFSPPQLDSLRWELEEQHFDFWAPLATVRSDAISHGMSSTPGMYLVGWRKGRLVFSPSCQSVAGPLLLY